MNRRGFVFGLCAPWALVLVACGGESSGTPYQGSPNPGLTPTDGAAADGSEDSSVGTTEGDGAAGATGDGGSSGADGASDATTACNTLVDTAPTVTTEDVASPPPVLTGGTIADGTYFLTALTVYTGDGGAAGASNGNSTTIEVDGTTIQLAMVGNSTATEMVTTSGSSFTDMRTCPAPATREGTYSATATTLTVQFQNGTADGGVNTIQETFTLQQ